MNEQEKNRSLMVGLKLIVGLVFSISLTGISVAGTLPQHSGKAQCDAFLGRVFGEAKITKATFVDAKDDIPEHCLVLGEMPKDLDFEVRMPAEWNGRTVFGGSGGFAGYIPNVSQYSTFSPDLAQRGYATIASNFGHNSRIMDANGAFILDQSWALDDQILEDYAYKAIPRVMSSAAQILTARYGESWTDTKVVYEGCSGAGRQGLLAAQRYPDLFDGIISRAPALRLIETFLSYQSIRKQLKKSDAGLTDAKLQVVSNAIMAKCDVDDGLKDGILGNPGACDFKVSDLACRDQQENDSCLTASQLESVRAFFEPKEIAGGRYGWDGFPLGTEFIHRWPDDGSGARSGGVSNYLVDGSIRYMVARDPSIDPINLDPAQYTDRIDKLVKMTDATDPDLTVFKNRGGKIILWTGLTDSAITANHVTGYYESVVEKMGGREVVDGFMEYYTSPGVEHCSGGPGADKFDLMGPMFEWLEKKTPPSTSTIIATKLSPTEGSTPIERPLCQYPTYAKYSDGNPRSAESFKCVE